MVAYPRSSSRAESEIDSSEPDVMRRWASESPSRDQADSDQPGLFTIVVAGDGRQRRRHSRWRLPTVDQMDAAVGWVEKACELALAMLKLLGIAVPGLILLVAASASLVWFAFHPSQFGGVALSAIGGGVLTGGTLTVLRLGVRRGSRAKAPADG